MKVQVNQNEFGMCGYRTAVDLNGQFQTYSFQVCIPGVDLGRLKQSSLRNRNEILEHMNLFLAVLEWIVDHRVYILGHLGAVIIVIES